VRASPSVEVVRFDVGPVRGVTDLPNGGVRIRSAFARTGVYEYSDGTKTWREYLPPEEAFSRDSLETLRGATVTDLHPPKLIDGSNWSQHARGHVGDNVTQDGDYIVGDTYIFDATLVQRIKANERRETSCGYKCQVDPTPGTAPNGVRYDAIQRNRRYNHVGIGPAGWGRQGPDVSLRMDGAAYQVSSERVSIPTDVTPLPSGSGQSVGSETRSDSSSENRPMGVFNYKGKQYKTDSAEDMAAAEGAVKQTEVDLTSQLEQANKKLTEAQVALATVSAQLQVKKATEEANKPAVPTDGEDAAALDARAEQRAVLKAAAREILGPEVKLDSMPSAEIRKAVVQKTMPEGYKLDSKADVIEGMFNTILAVRTQNAKRNDALNDFAADLSLPPDRNEPRGTERNDASDRGGTSVREDADPQTRLTQRTSERWKQPLSHTANGKG
jgi:hypothetical protein